MKFLEKNIDGIMAIVLAYQFGSWQNDLNAGLFAYCVVIIYFNRNNI